ncbi:hypothetical protein BYT27DRAFT_7112247 [Phlegmacium glaucopus]|nr:hypothetical protein BYT27DRAFT_7112247 [Phlegmacium glaucopus]
MSNQYLTAISENATRLGMRLQESFSEHTRDLSIARGVGAGYLDSAAAGGLGGGTGGNVDDAKIKNQLDGNSDREKLKAMTKLIALMSKGRNVSEYFAPVVKLVASPNLEIRKLVYIYLLRYAEQEPDLALLSINTFQKDLADNSPLIRAMALRVLSGIKVPMIGSIVVLAIKKCASDVSPYVRKAAALAIPKCFSLDSNHLPALIQIITTLLRDRSPLSLGCVAAAFEAVCPTRLDLLHEHYRRLCRILVEADEWGQVDLINLLLRYARTMLPRPMGRRSTGENKGVAADSVEEEEIDKDVKLLLESVEGTLQSRNPAVIMAATKVIFYAAPPSYWPKFVHPLMRLLMTSKEVERVVIMDLIIITKSVPHLFSPYYTRFLVRSDDILQVKKDKIKLLLNVLTVDNYQGILREFIDYADDVEDEVVSEAIRGLGYCATRIPESGQKCLTALITMIKSPIDIVVSNAVMVLQTLVQTQLSKPNSMSVASTSQSPLTIIGHLARKIDDIKHARARACVVWLVGQYGGSDETGGGPEGIAEWAPDVLRKMAKGFGQEEPLVKLQVVTLAAKLFVLNCVDARLGMLCRYVFSLARYDLNYDVRDRGRMLSGLLAGIGLQVNGDELSGVVLRREQVKVVLFEGKTGVADGYPGEYYQTNMKCGLVESSSPEMPDWLEKGVESSLRDSEYDVPVVAVTVPVVVPVPVVLPTGGRTDLDSFYADPEEELEDESEDESESESESGDDVILH